MVNQFVLWQEWNVLIMGNTDAKLVKKLREETGAGIMRCKEALSRADNDIKKATDILRTDGGSKPLKRESHASGNGAIGNYIHAKGKIAVMVEMCCETDFLAATEEFQTLIKDVCMHIAAANPLVLTRDDLPDDVIEKEREIARAQMRDKPPNVIEKIVDGKLSKFVEEVALLEQPFVKDPSVNIGTLLQRYTKQFGESLSITRFVRWERGKGE